MITFHTFRHWKATTEYHRTKDSLHVMDVLGHRDIKTTLIYTQLVNFEVDDYHSATAKTTDKAEQLVEAGFEYVCTTPQDVMLFRKRK
jgi:integrase